MEQMMTPSLTVIIQLSDGEREVTKKNMVMMMMMMMLDRIDLSYMTFTEMCSWYKPHIFQHSFKFM